MCIRDRAECALWGGLAGQTILGIVARGRRAAAIRHAGPLAGGCKGEQDAGLVQAGIGADRIQPVQRIIVIGRRFTVEIGDTFSIAHGVIDRRFGLTEWQGLGAA